MHNNQEHQTTMSRDYNKRNTEIVRQVRPLHSAADVAELEKHYSFLPPTSSSSTWQDRMVQHYHSHLYKEYVLADLTTRPGQVGLRWRTQEEVKRGMGFETCGNKHCPSYQQQLQRHQTQIAHDSWNTDVALLQLLEEYSTTAELPTTEQEEQALLNKVPPGLGLHDYEVPFSYSEHGELKTELVKLRLCLQCAPLLFRTRDPASGALEARRARLRFERCETHPSETTSTAPVKRDNNYRADRSDSSSSSSNERRKRRRRKKERKKTEKKRRRRDEALKNV